jgi:DNA-directed RNA polymerase I, II, and III subunit RPABC2
MPPKNKSNTKEIILKKNKSKKNLDDSDVEDSDEEVEDEENSDEVENEELQEDDNMSNNEVNEDDNKSFNEESDDEKSYSDKSDNDSKDDNDDDNYIDNQETLSKKCIKKYVSMEDDINLEEIFADEDNNIIKQDRITKPILTKYEKVRILSTRIKQLAQGAKPMLKNYSGLSSKEMALEELKNKIIPIIIERPVPNVGIEKWKLSELEILD